VLNCRNWTQIPPGVVEIPPVVVRLSSKLLSSPFTSDKRSGIARASNSVLWGKRGVYSTGFNT